MKVTIFVGSARKKHTNSASVNFAEQLEQQGDVQCEIVRLSEYAINTCKGCIVCFDKGEEYCPFSSDIQSLLDKMEQSDGVVFATPNYAFHMSGLMKLFLDRISFNFHRPRFFGKSATSIVTQGMYKGQDIVKYFQFIVKALGFNPVKGSCLTTLEPMSKHLEEKNRAVIEKHARIFYTALTKHQLKSPNLFELMIFRVSRTRIFHMLNESYRDYTYYLEKGWLESDFYYDVQLNPLTKQIGRFFDWIALKTSNSLEE